MGYQGYICLFSPLPLNLTILTLIFNSSTLGVTRFEMTRSAGSTSRPSWPPTPGEFGQYTPEATPSETDESPPLHAVNVAPRWNESKTTIWKVTATCLCAFVMGSNDAAYGAIIPYVCVTNSALLDLYRIADHLIELFS